MPSSNVCWGIEIGAGAIKAVKLEAEGNRVNLLDYAYIEHPKVLSTPDTNADDVLRVSLGRLVNEYDLSKAAISISIAGHQAFAKFAKLPPVEPKKVPDIVKFEAMQQIPFPLEQVEWDFQTFASPDSPEIEVGIFAVTREKVMERVRLLQDVGLTPNFVTLSPLAVFNALAFDLEFSEKSPGTVIVDVGNTSTDLIVADAGRLWVRTFPIGGHNFTQSLVETFKIGYGKAEAIKLEAEASKHARQAFSAMRNIFTDLGQDIQRSIGYHQSLHKDAKLSRMIGVGSTFLLPGLRKFLQQQVGLEVFRVEEFKRVNTASLKDADRAKAFNENALRFCSAYGLALQGLKLTPINANLMPVPVLRDTMWREKAKWFGLAAVLAVAASVAMFIRPGMDYFAKAGAAPPGEIAATLNEHAAAKSEAEKAGVIGDAKADWRAANLAALLEGKSVYGKLMEDVGTMFTDANSKAKFDDNNTAPAFTLKSLDTVYAGPGQVDPATGAPVATPETTGHITVTLTVQCKQADAQQFAIQTLKKWLDERKGKFREGVPFTITRVESPSREAIETRVAEAPEVAANDNNQNNEFNNGGGGKSGRPMPRVIGGGGKGSGGGGGEAPSGDVSQLAPTKRLAPRPPFVGDLTTLKIEWTVTINAPGAKAPDAKTDEKAKG